MQLKDATFEQIVNELGVRMGIKPSKSKMNGPSEIVSVEDASLVADKPPGAVVVAALDGENKLMCGVMGPVGKVFDILNHVAGNVHGEMRGASKKKKG